MILVRFKHTFRERLPEWITALALVGWGLIVLSEPSVMWDQQYFSVLAKIASQATWGLAATIIGFGRLIALIINGAWRPTAHLRAIGAFAGAMLWASILLSYATLPWTPPAMAAKGALLTLDLLALWWAAGDAKLADIKAKKMNGNA